MSDAAVRLVSGSDEVTRLVERAQAEERAGSRESARASYEAALRLCTAPSQAHVAVQIVRWIGRTHFEDGDIEAALDCAQTSLAMAEAHQDLPGMAHAYNLLGTAHHHRGELDVAVALYRKARSYGLAAQDQRLVALIDLNLGAAASVRGDNAEALEHYHASLTGFRLAGAEEHAAHVLNNLGMLYTHQERWDEAERAFADAAEVCVRVGNPSIQVMVEVNRADLWIARGAYEQALTACDAAARLVHRLGDERARGELQKHYGVIYREMRDFERSAQCLGDAARVAAEREDLLLVGEVAREHAELLRRQGRHQETLRELNRAHRAFQQLRARHDLADVDGRVASLESQFLEIVRGWGESIESVDRYTQGHCRRVADYACLLARAAGMDEQDLFWFRLGGLLHDVGKIVVPAEILNKPGKLDPEERAIIERHPDAGVELLADLEFPWDIRPMVRHHHEQWGGGGYPLGLAGEEIPLSARVLGIADVYDALTSDRPYRPGHPHERALEIMRDMESHFDPTLMALWEELCRSGVIGLPSAGEVGPAGRPRRPTRESPLPDAGRGSDLSRTEILIIASDPEAVEWIGDALGSGGLARIHVAPGGSSEEAFDRLGTQRFDAILLHVASGDGSAIGSLARVHEWAPEVPIVVLSDRDDEAFALRAVREGVQDYIPRDEVTGPRIARAVHFAMERNRQRLEERARSLVDDLTGLYNRRGFFSISRKQWLIASRQKKEMVLFLVDVDGLKQINDRYGHNEGDAALIDAGTVLRETFRESDIVARLGGDEFGILVADASESLAEAMIARLNDGLRRHNVSRHRPYTLGLSVGTAVYRPQAPVSIEDLVSQADQSMYGRKRRKEDPFLRIHPVR